MQLTVLDLKVELGSRDVLVYTDLRLGRAVVLDFYFEVKGCHTLEGNGNDFLTLCLARTVTIRLSGLVEAGARTRMNRLLNSDGRKVLL